MARNGLFTGLDIGTSSIKVLVAEFIDGRMNVIGVSNVASRGIKEGVIIDIEVAQQSISEALEQAKEKAGVEIKTVSIGLPANQLQIEPAQGMIAIQNDTNEISDKDVESVVRSALTKSVTQDREVISLVPEEFILDNFKGIRDPRGMMGVRLEMRGTIYTGPATMLHNLRITLERAGVGVDNFIISPLALTKSSLNEGEREFGATVLDMGGGQTSVAIMRQQELNYTDVYMGGGDYVTKDISKVLRTSWLVAENLKHSFGRADLANASLTETVQVEVVGKSQPEEVSEHYLADIISSRLSQTLNRIKHDLDRRRFEDLHGGLVLTGGGSILPGVVELAQAIFGTPVKLHMPNQVGIRNPIFSNVVSLVEYVGDMSEVEVIAQKAVAKEEQLRRKPRQLVQEPTKVSPQAQFKPSAQPVQPNHKVVELKPEKTVEATSVDESSVTEPAANEPEPTTSQPKKNLGDKVRGFFGNMFD